MASPAQNSRLSPSVPSLQRGGPAKEQRGVAALGDGHPSRALLKPPTNPGGVLGGGGTRHISPICSGAPTPQASCSPNIPRPPKPQGVLPHPSPWPHSGPKSQRCPEDAPALLWLPGKHNRSIALKEGGGWGVLSSRSLQLLAVPGVPIQVSHLGGFGNKACVTEMSPWWCDAQVVAGGAQCMHAGETTAPG